MDQLEQTPYFDKRAALNELASSNLPTLIYGNGNYAQTLFAFLKKNNIDVVASIVDNEYLSSPIIWNSLSVVPIKNIDNLYSKYNIIIGFSDFLTANNNIQKNVKNIHKSYFFDSITFFDFMDDSFIKENKKQFVETLNMLYDDKSKETMMAFLKGKLTSNPIELYKLVEKNQYFPDNIFTFNEHEIFFDIGAYNGDTIREFITKTSNKYQKIYALEPDKTNFNELTKYIKTNNVQNIQYFNKGAWSRRDNLFFQSEEDFTVKSNINHKGETEVEVDSVDNILGQEKVTYIKMDVEGSELETLKGAINSIKKWKPKLAVSMYHKKEDLITIPKFIKEIRPDYCLFLRHHMYITQELVLYAM